MQGERQEVTAERLWKVSEVARYLQMSISWVYKQVEAGLLPHRRFGTSVRFRADDIRAYAAGLWQPEHSGRSVGRESAR